MKTSAVVLIVFIALGVSTTLAQFPGVGLFEEEAAFTAGHVLKHYRNLTFTAPNHRRRRLPAVRLAYVTPWNKDGYRRTLEGASAFTHVSPCWFEAQRNAAESVLNPHKPVSIVVNGAGHINATWGFRANEAGIKVVPRVLVNLADLGGEVFTSAAVSQSLTKAIVKAVYGPDRKFAKWVSGIVLDWGGFPLANKQMAPKEGVRRFLTDLRQALSEGNDDRDDLVIILVIPPDAKAITPAEYKWLVPLVDYLQIMTYDFNGGATAPKENAPMTWVDTVVRAVLRVKKSLPTERKSDGEAFPRSKLLLGINLYGARFQRGGKPREAIDGKTWIKLLADERRLAKALKTDSTKEELDQRPVLVWGSETCEHSAELYVPKSGVEFVFFPSIAALLHRIHYAAEIGLGGVAAWELGQGLDYFTTAFEP